MLTPCNAFERYQISTTLVEKFTSVNPETLQMSRTIMAVVKVAIGEQGERTCDDCSDAMVTSTLLKLLEPLDIPTENASTSQPLKNRFSTPL